MRSGVNCALGIAVVYAAGSLAFLHFFDVGIIGMFIDTNAELEVVGMAQEYLMWNSLFFLPLGVLIVWRYVIQGLGYSSIAMLAGVAEMIRPHRRGTGPGADAGLLRRVAVQPGRLDCRLHFPVPGVLLDHTPPGQPAGGPAA